MLAAHDAAMDAEEEAMQHAQEVALPELRELNQQLQAQQQSVVENAALIAAQSQPAASRQPLSNSNKTNTQSASSVGREPSSTRASSLRTIGKDMRLLLSLPLPLSAFCIS